MVGKKDKLISYSRSKINKMSEKQLLKEFEKATYDQVFTQATWNAMDSRFASLIRKKNK